tara:strand:+ start:401 stop:637 length:237 start_codon:yes stop_codon:yes gene_type:complete
MSEAKGEASHTGRTITCNHCGSGDYVTLDASAVFDNATGEWVLGTLYDEEVCCNNHECPAATGVGGMSWSDFTDTGAS